MVQSIQQVYDFWLAKAQRRKWKIPTRNERRVHGLQAWVDYWIACEAYERNPELGRPVVPHRSGGGYRHMIEGPSLLMPPKGK